MPFQLYSPYLRRNYIFHFSITHIDGKIIFDMKMDFARKTSWIAAGHKTPDNV